jgi:hypothetical protein
MSPRPLFTGVPRRKFLRTPSRRSSKKFALETRGWHHAERRASLKRGGHLL